MVAEDNDGERSIVDVLDIVPVTRDEVLALVNDGEMTNRQIVLPSHLPNMEPLAVDRPSDGEAGRIEFKQPTAAQRLRLRRWYQERAVILRVGALVTSMDWLSKGCAWDRRQVRKIAGLLEIPVDAFEADVEVDAKEMLADSRFDAPHRALCRELRDHLREVMPGDRAHAIMKAAIAAA